MGDQPASNKFLSSATLASLVILAILFIGSLVWTGGNLSTPRALSELDVITPPQDVSIDLFANDAEGPAPDSSLPTIPFYCESLDVSVHEGRVGDELIFTCIGASTLPNDTIDRFRFIITHEPSGEIQTFDVVGDNIKELGQGRFQAQFVYRFNRAGNFTVRAIIHSLLRDEWSS